MVRPLLVARNPTRMCRVTVEREVTRRSGAKHRAAHRSAPRHPCVRARAPWVDASGRHSAVVDDIGDHERGAFTFPAEVIGPPTRPRQHDPGRGEVVVRPLRPSRNGSADTEAPDIVRSSAAVGVTPDDPERPVRRRTSTTPPPPGCPRYGSTARRLERSGRPNG